MKNISYIVVLLFVTLDCFSQKDTLGEWIISGNIAVEAHDKRLFRYSERETLLAMQPEFWGTYHKAIHIHKKVWSQDKLSLYTGAGMHYQKATFIRPFNHHYFKKDSFLIIRNLNSHIKRQISASMLAFYQLSEHWYASGQLSTNLLTYRKIDQTEYNFKYFPYSQRTLELEEVKLQIGINYMYRNFWMGLHTGAINFQKIDKLIFNHTIKDPRTDQKWEWYFPVKVQLTLGVLF